MDAAKPSLTLEALFAEAKIFAEYETAHREPSIYRATDGKAVGTYLELKFRLYLALKYNFVQGNSASGVDFPELNIDMKVTSVKQPQSSCPFRSARQKIYGLGYGVLIFVYNKVNDDAVQTSTLHILHTIYVEPGRTADFQTTRAILNVLENDGNADDLIAVMLDKNLPVDEIIANQLAEEILTQPPNQGYLTISNALQWRLQYRRVIDAAGEVSGVYKLHRQGETDQK